VRALGHRLGAHTWTHYLDGLPRQLQDGGDIIDEMARTAAWFDPAEDPLAFRPPYGAWSRQVATMLNADDVLSARHVGPFNWAIHCPDWQAWLDGVDPVAVAHAFRADARARRRGIVLLHDYTAEAHNRPEPRFRIMAERNRSVELTRALVPMLVADGFRFAPLGAVPVRPAAA
jgi:peptidoglycan/xylan/chitin deacetylase (PgdA/CDA1 family)